MSLPQTGHFPYPPRSLPGLYGLWDAAFLLDLGNGDPVSSTPDVSGNGRHATSSGGNRPLYRPSIDGLPCWEFDGTNDRLDWSAAAIPTGNTSYTMWAIARSPGTTTTRNIGGFGTGATRRACGLAWPSTAGSTLTQSLSWIWGDSSSMSHAAAANEWQLLIGRYTGSTRLLEGWNRTKGAKSTRTIGADADFAAEGGRIGSNPDGASSFVNGYVAVYGICVGALSNAYLTWLGQFYAATKGLTLVGDV